MTESIPNDSIDIFGNQINFKGKTHLPQTEELKNRAIEQKETREKLQIWTKLSNEDTNKTKILYAMLDGKLFYNKLNNFDKKKFADELLNMSQDEKNFDDQNRLYFKYFSNYLQNLIHHPKEVIESELDLQIDNLSEEFLEYNINLFLEKEEITKIAR